MRFHQPLFATALFTIAVLLTTMAATPVTAQPLRLPPQQTGYLGLVVEARGGGAGLKVVELSPGGPAEQGGLQVGDHIFLIGTQAINSPTDLGRALGGKPAGSGLRIRFVRAGVEGEATITLGTAPPRDVAPGPLPPAGPAPLPGQAVPALPDDATDDGILLGVQTGKPQLRDLLRIKAPGQFTRGALVKRVYPGTPAARAGLDVDTLIYAVDGREVTSPAELIRRIKRVGPGNTTELSVYRNGREEKIQVQLLAPRTAEKPPVNRFPPQAAGDADLEARLGALERRMTMIEQRLIDLQRSIDALRQP